jgi:hypothetical protein
MLSNMLIALPSLSLFLHPYPFNFPLPVILPPPSLPSVIFFPLLSTLLFSSYLYFFFLFYHSFLILLSFPSSCSYLFYISLSTVFILSSLLLVRYSLTLFAFSSPSLVSSPLVVHDSIACQWRVTKNALSRTLMLSASERGTVWLSLWCVTPYNKQV